MTKVTSKTGKEYIYVGTTFKGDTEALQALAVLKEKNLEPGLVAIALRMMMRDRKE